MNKRMTHRQPMTMPAIAPAPSLADPLSIELDDVFEAADVALAPEVAVDVADTEVLEESAREVETADAEDAIPDTRLETLEATTELTEEALEALPVPLVVAPEQDAADGWVRLSINFSDGNAHDLQK